jgi:hypothetical protein
MLQGMGKSNRRTKTMIYTDLGSLCEGVVQCDTDDKNSVSMFKVLIAVYFDALDNPPEGVIGVGAISYAQEMLVNAQFEGIVQ